MKRILFLLLLLEGLLCQAQLKVLKKWDKNYGGGSYDYLKDFKAVRNGGYIMIATSSSNVGCNKTTTESGEQDPWIIRTDSLGNIIWQKSIGGVSSDEGERIFEMPDSGFIAFCSAKSDSSGLKTQNSRGDFDYWVVRLDKFGNIVWQKTIGGDGIDRIRSVAQVNNNYDFLIGGLSHSGISGEKTDTCRGINDAWLVKIDSSGNIKWQKTYGGSGRDFVAGLLALSDGFLVLCLSESGISGDKTTASKGRADYWIIRTDLNGNIIWQKDYGSSNDDSPQSAIEMSDGYLISGGSSWGTSGDKTDYGFVPGSDIWCVKVDFNGNKLWDKAYGGTADDDPSKAILKINNRYYIFGNSKAPVSGNKTVGTNGDYDGWIFSIDEDGNISSNQFGMGGTRGDYIINLSNKGEREFAFGFLTESNAGGDKSENKCGTLPDIWVFSCLITDNFDSISGQVFEANNTDCVRNPNEKSIGKVIVKTEPKVFYAISDTSGKYTLLIDTGTYKVKAIIPQYLTPLFDGGIACPLSGYHSVSFSSPGQDTSQINFARYVKQCPYLQIEFSQDRMRRCGNNNGTIKYCNIGVADTNNVKVHLRFPEYLSLVSADKAYTQAPDGHFIFDIGNLNDGECGEIHIVDYVACVSGITGLTQCIQTWITPTNTCVDKSAPNFNLWDKSEIAIKGNCAGSSIRFVISNTGMNMADSSSYRTYKDGVYAGFRKFKLQSGDSLVLNIAALPNTIRLEADQRPFHPGNSQPSASVQGCPQSGSLSSPNNLPQDNENIDVEVHCLAIRDSYDPNDKIVSPEGVGTDKLVKHGVSLNYMVRFQNTGNDTAYKVVIIDTLDVNLDISTLELGVTSHTCQTSFTGSGRPILKFTFDPIKLVDSMTNEPMSHGFVSFKIKPYDSTPNGTVVKNAADIYFDFNDPIRTNTAQVTINDNLPTGAVLNVITTVRNNISDIEYIKIYPNPFSKSTTFEFENNSKADQLSIYDLSGKVIFTDIVRQKQIYILQRDALPAGMYFYSIVDTYNVVVGRGKLIAQ